ncbi:MAG: pyridoxal phosphate-dependent aminotransferase [Dehalococcoidia bacterium]|nr:pyridoxal phosphate-dependent aminotransferase [Dehalococcoidia bacterium]
MGYNFDLIINRYGTGSIKWDRAEAVFGCRDVIPMWIADMDFRTAEPIVTALRKVAEYGIYGYATRLPSYYQAFIGWMKRRHNWEPREEWIEFTPGVVPAIAMAVRSLTDPGDEVIVQTPVYHPFFHAVINNHRTILDNPLRLENGRYVMDMDDLRQKLTPRTKLMLLCSPHNPGGRVWTKSELTALGELCLEHNIIVVSDEIHADIVYPGHKHTVFATISREFAENSIVCTGVSKTFNLAGLTTSNIVIPNQNIRKRFHQETLSCGINLPNLFGLVATETAYNHGEPWLEELLKYLESNVEYLITYTEKNIPYIKVMRPEGTYLAWLDCRSLPLTEERAKNFMPAEARVGLEAGTIFGVKETGFWRMNFACPRGLLQQALERIEKAVRNLNGPK